MKIEASELANGKISKFFQDTRRTNRNWPEIAENSCISFYIQLKDRMGDEVLGSIPGCDKVP